MRIFAVALIAGVVLSSFAAHAAPAKKATPARSANAECVGGKYETCESHWRNLGWATRERTAYCGRVCGK